MELAVSRQKGRPGGLLPPISYLQRFTLTSGHKVTPRAGDRLLCGSSVLQAGAQRRPHPFRLLPVLPRNKFVEFDMKPVCKRCYEKFPLELKKRLKKLSELAARRAQPKSSGLPTA